MGKLLAHNLCNHQRIMKGEERCRLDDACLKSPRLDLFLFILLDCTASQSVHRPMNPSSVDASRVFASLLCRRLSPVLVDSVLQLDNGKISDLDWYGVI